MKKLLLLITALQGGLCSGMNFSLTKEQLDAMPDDQRRAMMAFLQSNAARQTAEEVDNAGEMRDSESLDVDTQDSELSSSRTGISRDKGAEQKMVLSRSNSSVVDSGARDSGGRSARTATSPRLRARTTATDLTSDKRSSADSSGPKKAFKGAFASLSKLTGRKAQSEIVEGSDRDSDIQDGAEERRKSPRSPRPSAKDTAHALAKQKEDYLTRLKTMGAAVQKSGQLTDKQFENLVEKAQDPELITLLCEWVIANDAYVSIEQFRSMLDQLIKLSGVDFSAVLGNGKTEKKGALSLVANLFSKNKEADKARAFFQQVLSMVEHYSKKLHATAASKFPFDDESRALADIYAIIIKTLKTGAEAELCEALRAAVVSDDEKDVLVNMLVKMLIDALPDECDLLKDNKLNLQDEQVIGAFVLKWAGKIDDELADAIVTLARGLDGRLGKKEQCCVAFLKEWADEPHNAGCITLYCEAQISGDTREARLGRNKTVANDVLKRLTVFLRRNAPQQVAPVQKVTGGGLAAQMQGLKDAEDVDTTFTRLRKRAQQHREKHNIVAPGEKKGVKKAPLSKEEAAYEKATNRLGACNYGFDDDLPELRDDFNADEALCWVCKASLDEGEVIRANARQECEHKIHKDCCAKVNPRNMNSCGVCKVLIQPHAQLRLAYKAWEIAQFGADARQSYQVLPPPPPVDDYETGTGVVYEFSESTVFDAPLDGEEEVAAEVYIDPQELQELKEKALLRAQAAQVAQRDSGGLVSKPPVKKALPTPPAKRRDNAQTDSSDGLRKSDGAVGQTKAFPSTPTKSPAGRGRGRRLGESQSEASFTPKKKSDQNDEEGDLLY